MKATDLNARKKSIVAILSIVIIVVLDQITKLMAFTNLRGRPGFSYLGDMLRLEYAENSGAFLSLGATLDPGMRTLLFIIGVVVIIGACAYWLITSPQTWLSLLALSFVIAGGIGNLIDRISRGSVIDFIYMGVGPLHTGVFNVADMAISGGLILMLYDQYKLGKNQKELK